MQNRFIIGKKGGGITELQQLKYFKAVADVGKISEAAEKLFVSAPALSVSITRLEKELGVQLFDRTNNRILLNKQGEIFLKHVNQILDTLENAKQQAEIKFRLLYATLMNNRQAVENANAALELEQLTYDAATLKYQQGTISHNALLMAEDDLQTAREAVVTAENDLFAAYNQYNWAVKHGILS